MEKYIGTKLVAGTPMTRQAYNDYRGWTLPADEDGADDGYLVEYLDGGKPNHPAHEGYISWSPKAQFDAAYRPTNGMTFGLAIEALKMGKRVARAPTTGMAFGLAIEALKMGKRVARAGWNGKGMWLSLVNSGDWTVPNKNYVASPEFEGEPHLLPWIGMKTADNGFVPWLASQTDMLTDDWVIVE